MEKIYECAEFLTSIPSINGTETEYAAALSEFCSKNYPFDEIKVIPTGTVLCFIKSKNENAKTLLIDAHMDEIGFVVTNVFDDGFVSVAAVGGVDTRVLSASEVTVYGKKEVKGVFTSKPPHLQTAGEQNKKLELKDLYIDTGLSGESLKELVKIGDFADMSSPMSRLLGNRVACRALDDKLCIATILRSVSMLDEKPLDLNICCQFSSGEETGLSGAVTGTYAVSPDYAIVLDVCNPKYPDGDKMREETDLGNGCVITLSPTTSRSFTKKLIECAKQNEIKHVTAAASGRTGTNAHVTAISREGVPTALISIPLRYMHTASEVADLKDCIEASKLTALFIKQLEGEAQ